MRLTAAKINWVMGGLGAALFLAVMIIPRIRGGSSEAAHGGNAADTGHQVLWKFKSENGAVVSIALGPDGTVYAGANNALYALTPDGNLKWKTTFAGLLYLSVSKDGTIYAASSHGFVFGAGSDGKIVWDPRAGLIGFGAPGTVGAYGRMLYANTVSDLYAFEPERSTGVLWWQSTFREGSISEKSSLPGSARVGDIPSKNSPVIWRDETIILPRQHWLHYFDPDGQPGWFNELTPGHLGQAALDDDGVTYVPDDHSTVFAVTHHGDLKWKYQADGYIAGSPVIGPDGTIYTTTARTVYALTPDGSVKWSVKSPQQCMSGAALAADGTLYISGDTGLFSLRSDGSEKWSMGTMSGTGSPTIAADGTIYFPCGYTWVCATRDEGSPLAKGPWPKIYHDAANTSRILTVF